MIEWRRGDILQANTEAITNTVNCFGVMGKGLALQFKRCFPAMYRAYVFACQCGKVETGKMWVWQEPEQLIVNFPTKRHWRDLSRLDYIVCGLVDLERVVRSLDLKSLALPALGCQNGGLDWKDVKPLIEAFHERLPAEVRLVVYEPKTGEQT